MVYDEFLARLRDTDEYAEIFSKHAEIMKHYYNEPKLETLIWEATLNCNLNCLHCSVRAGAQYGSDMTDVEIMSLIDCLIHRVKITKVFISGGEALMQQEALCELIEKFEDRYGRRPYIELETNGTIIPLERLDKLVDRFNVYLKLGNSMYNPPRETLTRRVKDDIFKIFLENEKTRIIFTVGNQDDLKEIQELEKIFKIERDIIWLRPLVLTTTGMSVNLHFIWNACLNFNYKFSNRLHIQVHGPNAKQV